MARNPKPPRPASEREVVVVVPAAVSAGKRERNWDLDTCAVCMRKGRWGGLACPRCADKVAPPPGWTESQKATSYTAEANAKKRGISA